MAIANVSVTNFLPDIPPRPRRWIPLSLRMFAAILFVLGSTVCRDTLFAVAPVLNAAAAAGPTGAAANGYNADSMKVDVLTYSRTKGLFAGVSLEGASMETDDDANKAVYGKSITAKQIIDGGESTPAAGKGLVDLLDKTSPAKK